MRSILWGMLIAAGLLLAACNPEEKKDATLAGTPGGGQTDSAPASDEPIKFGFNFEMSGNAATFGTSAKQGAELALEEINAAGGVLGRQIAGVYEDNQSQPGPSASAASKLVNQDRVDALIGALGSSQSIAMAKIAEESGVPMVTPASTNPRVTLNDDGSVRQFVFRACFTDDFQGEGIVDFAVKKLGAKAAVVFYDAENDYAVGIYETVKRVAPDKGLAIVAEDSYLQSAETDFRAKLNKFKQQQFDVLIVPGYYNQVALIANQAREVGLTQPLLGGDGFDSPELFKVAGKNIVGSYFTNHYAADDQDPAVQGFIEKYKQHYGGNVPDAMCILTYDATKMMADAISRAGSTDPAAVVAALAKTSGFKGAAGTITINATHDATKKLVVLEIAESGKFQWIYTYDPLATGTPEAAAPAKEADQAAADPAASAADLEKAAEDVTGT